MIFDNYEIINLFDKEEPITINKYLNKFNIKDVKKFIDAKTIEDNSHYINIDKASKIIKNFSGNQMYILVDSDLDGDMSACVAYRFMKEYKPNIDILDIHHSEENPKAHGLEDEEVMELLRNNEPTLLWIPDAGSSNVLQCKELSELGYTIIITDHHEQTAIKEGFNINDYAVVINNKIGNVENRDGSGALVTWHLCYNISKRIANKLISYVMVSLISDSCNMNTYENYTFSLHGKEKMVKPIKQLVTKYNYKSGQSNNDYSFGMISKCNATIRLGTLEDKEWLFRFLVEEDDNSEGLFKIATSYHNTQKKKVEEIKNSLGIEDNNKNYILQEIKEKTSLTGLVANKLKTDFGKTVILVHERNNGEMAGSVRSDIYQLKDMMSDTGLFNYNEGHGNVFGTSYNKENEAEVINALDTIFASYKPQIKVIGIYRSDSIPKEIFDVREDLDELNICGKGLEYPQIKTNKFEVNGTDFIELTSTMFKLIRGDIEYLFKFIGSDKKTALNIGKNKKFYLEILGEPQYNVWGDNKTMQINVTDYEIKEETWEDLF